jgi:hypothetical protein
MPAVFLEGTRSGMSTHVTYQLEDSIATITRRGDGLLTGRAAADEIVEALR